MYTYRLEWNGMHIIVIHKKMIYASIACVSCNRFVYEYHHEVVNRYNIMAFSLKQNNWCTIVSYTSVTGCQYDTYWEWLWTNIIETLKSVIIIIIHDQKYIWFFFQFDLPLFEWLSCSQCHFFFEYISLKYLSSFFFSAPHFLPLPFPIINHTFFITTQKKGICT